MSKNYDKHDIEYEFLGCLYLQYYVSLWLFRGGVSTRSAMNSLLT